MGYSMMGTRALCRSWGRIIKNKGDIQELCIIQFLPTRIKEIFKVVTTEGLSL
jgi:hypothetical protein